MSLVSWKFPGKDISFSLKFTLLQLGDKLQLKLLEMELLKEKIIKSFIDNYRVLRVLLN